MMEPARSNIEYRVKLPFGVQAPCDCGPQSLALISQYLGIQEPIERLRDLISPNQSGMTWTQGLARAGAAIGLQVDYYSTSIGLNLDNLDLPFYSQLADSVTNVKAIKTFLLSEAHRLGVRFHERDFNLQEHLAKLSSDVIGLVLVDWNVIVGQPSYLGHFAPIVGYDSKCVFIHDVAVANGAYLPIEKSLFDNARRSPGTAQDFLTFSRKG